MAWYTDLAVEQTFDELLRYGYGELRLDHGAGKTVLTWTVKRAATEESETFRKRVCDAMKDGDSVRFIAQHHKLEIAYISRTAGE